MKFFGISEKIFQHPKNCPSFESKNPALVWTQIVVGQTLQAHDATHQSSTNQVPE